MMITAIGPSMIDSYGNPGILSQNKALGFTVKLPVNSSPFYLDLAPRAAA